jgi:hypothetical protein
VNRSRVRRQVSIPSISTSKSQTKDYEFVKGVNSNSSNDDLDINQWRYATDVREVQIGKWATRYGNSPASIPIGEVTNVLISSTVGASTAPVNATSFTAQKVTATASGRLSKMSVGISNAGTATGIVFLSLCADNAGQPGAEILRSTIQLTSIITTPTMIRALTIACPDIVNGTSYWLVCGVQAGATGSYAVSSTTTGTNAMTSSDGGQTWATASGIAFLVGLYTAPATPVKGTIRIKRPGGANITFMAVNDTLYTVNESTTVTTAVDTGLDPTATYCRFCYVNDTLYYVQGTTKPRKLPLDTMTPAVVTAAPENASDIIENKGIVFYLSADDTSKSFYTNFGIYDTFTSTDFFYVPSPKTGDPCKALVKLNGNLHVINRRSKHVLYGSENATFRLEPAVGQKGTFSRDSVAYDSDYVFLASDDGIYQYNGAEERNITEDVLDWWASLLNKANTVLELHSNRLFIFYTPNGEAQNTRCKVYNVLYGIWESEDTRTYVGATYTRYDTDNRFIQGSNRIGMIMYGELVASYSNMGEALSFELRTGYQHYGTPAQYKRASNYRPHFDAVTGTYAVQVGYATDYSDSPTFSDISLGSDSPRFNSGLTFNSGVKFGGSQHINPTTDNLVIPGSWRRLQIRYKHISAREPVSFDGHVLGLETQRMT